MLLHQHHGVPYSGIPWFNNVPIQQLVNGIINDATLVGANLAGGLGEQARVVSDNGNSNGVDKAGPTIKRESVTVSLQDLNNALWGRVVGAISRGYVE